MPNGSWRGRRRHLLLMLIAGVIVPGALFSVNFFQSRSHAMAAAEDGLARRSAVLAEHAARVLDGYALVFDLLDADLPRHSDAEISRSDVISTRLAEHAARATIGSTVLVLDRDGTVLASSLGRTGTGSSSADRAYFNDAIANRGLILGEQIIGRVTGERLFPLSRQGENGRVYAALIATAYFERQFATLTGNDEANLVVSLYREDGTQLVRYPPRPEPVNLAPGNSGFMKHVPGKQAGTYQSVPVVGTRERLFAFNRVAGYPLFVTYGVDVDDLLAGWRRSMVTNGLLALSAALLLGVVSLMALWRAEQAARTEGVLAALVTERTAEAELRTSEAVEAMRARETALQSAERANAAKAHFLAAASHDLRQPIQGLRLFLEVLEARLQNDPENYRVLALAKKALEGAEDLLSTLLDVSTLEAGMVEPTMREVSVGPILSQLAEEFGRQAESRLLALHFVRCGAHVRTDPVLLARLLRNLLTNAIRYTERGGILMGCRRQGGELRIEVWDTGPGIPADKLDSVFEDFVQLGNPERDRAKGLGLGLSVVRRMAGLMGHPIGVCSVVGKGTVFWVRLPLATGMDTPVASELSPA